MSSPRGAGHESLLPTTAGSGKEEGEAGLSETGADDGKGSVFATGVLLCSSGATNPHLYLDIVNSLRQSGAFP
jgi:hypothetical protein